MKSNERLFISIIIMSTLSRTPVQFAQSSTVNFDEISQKQSGKIKNLQGEYPNDVNNRKTVEITRQNIL